jgi:hypothetical protein
MGRPDKIAQFLSRSRSAAPAISRSGRRARPTDPPIVRLPLVASRDPIDSALVEISAAIALVVAGVAVTMTLCSLEAAEEAAFSGAMWAQAAGVAFRIKRDPPDSVSLVIGPRLGQEPAPIASESGS